MRLILQSLFRPALLALFVGASLFSGFGARTVRADAPGTPQLGRLVVLDSTRVTVYWYNAADESVWFNLRYYIQGGPDDFTDNKYIDGGGPPDDSYVDYRTPALPRVAFRGIGGYVVTGLDPDTSYCFSMRAWDLYTPLSYPLVDSRPDFSPWSGELCARTKPAPTPPPPTPAPAPSAAEQARLAGYTVPGTNLSSVAAASEEIARKSSIIVSPTANQLTHDVLVNVVREKQDKDDGVFEFEWNYLQAGNWVVTDFNSTFSVLDKTKNPNGVTLPAAMFTAFEFQCEGRSQRSCAFRTWRLRAHLVGVPDAPWSPYTQFRVQ